MRRAARTDANHTAIIKAMRQLGAYVIDTSALPKFVDAVAGFRGHTFLVEIKRPPGPKGGTSGRHLTPDQAKLHAEWTGGTLVLMDSPEAAVRALMTTEVLF